MYNGQEDPYLEEEDDQFISDQESEEDYVAFNFAGSTMATSLKNVPFFSGERGSDVEEWIAKAWWNLRLVGTQDDQVWVAMLVL